VEPGKADASQYDNVVVAVNKAELVSDYVRSVGNGGTVLAFSGLRKGETFDIDSHAIHYREVTLTGCSGFASSNFNKSFDMIRKDPGHYGRRSPTGCPRKGSGGVRDPSRGAGVQDRA
jgi:D-arabinose 1-dehydrogenase-like Zn-dependent alcohol dehydrogenase